jgi:hypothetical protein
MWPARYADKGSVAAIGGHKHSRGAQRSRRPTPSAHDSWVLRILQENLWNFLYKILQADWRGTMGRVSLETAGGLFCVRNLIGYWIEKGPFNPVR